MDCSGVVGMMFCFLDFFVLKFENEGVVFVSFELCGCGDGVEMNMNVGVGFQSVDVGRENVCGSSEDFSFLKIIFFKLVEFEGGVKN